MRKILILALLLPVLVAAQVVSYVSSPSAAAPSSTLNNGLLSFWKFDGNANDAVGSVNLTAENGAYFSATGKSGQAMSCELDSSQYAYVASNSSLSFSRSTSFTVAAWIKMETSTASRMYIINHYDYYQYALLILSSNVARGIVSNTYAHTTATLNDNTWGFVCMWYDTNTDSIYTKINGNAPSVTYRDQLFPFSSSTHSLYVGAAPNYYFDGLIDDLGVWNRCGRVFADSLYNSGNGWRP